MEILPLFFAHGQVLVPITCIGVPAVVVASLCFVLALFLGPKQQEKDIGMQRVLTLRRTLTLTGVILVFVALFSPAFEPFFS